ncbi:MAG TPA: hypothetical protein VMC03_17500, partial [Streptosporangiaceae bacterium]|nr:hypothetical protein [Streptosporangiaceae bacterium]
MGDRLVDDRLTPDRWRHPGPRVGEPLVFNLLYGDFEGGQRVITQFAVRKAGERWLTQATRHCNVDRPDPRQIGDPLSNRAAHAHL